MTTLFVSATAQTVDIRGADQALLWRAPVSTSKFGLGETEGSNKTPRGWFHVSEKIGDGAPLGAVFESRVFTGEVWDGKPTERDLILTRILRLAGDEPRNANTLARYVYFHGTNQEELIGQPASHGCVRLSNADMKKLFEQSFVGQRVYIE